MLLEAIDELSLGNKIEAKQLLEGYKKQRRFFFDRRVKELGKIYNLNIEEEEALWGYLLSAEESNSGDSLQNRDILPNLENLKAEEEFCNKSEINFAYLGWLIIYWSSAWRKYAYSNKEILSSRFVLSKRQLANDKVSFLSNAEDELIRELKKSFPEIVKEIGIHVGLEINEKIVTQLDRKAISYFKQHNIGKASKDLVKNLEKIIQQKNYSPSNRIKFWKNPLHIFQITAACRWLDYTRRFIHVVNEKPAALTAPIFCQMSDTLAKGNYLNDECTKLLNNKGTPVIKMNQLACLNLATAKSVLRSGIPLLSSVTAYYVVTWLIKQVHKQFLMNHKEPRKILLKGDAFYRLGELSGAGTSAATIAKIRKIIPALSGCVFRYKTHDRIGEGNFLNYQYEKAIGQNLSFLEIELQPIACPGFVNTLPSGGVEYQEQRQMLPILNIFPFTGRRNEHSSQARFQTELLLEMRPRAKEIYLHGGIQLSYNDLINIAERAEMKPKLIDQVMKLWVKEKCISITKDNLYRLGERELGARQMLEQAGKYELEGALAGKSKSQNKRKAIFKKK